MPDNPTAAPLHSLTDTALHVMVGMAISALDHPDYQTGALCQIADEMTSRARWHRLLAQLPSDLAQRLTELETADRMAYLDLLAEENHAPPRLASGSATFKRPRHLRAVKP
ncbi:hypothetical protein FDJ57_gp59 [Gordonia phage Sour]|uniref:DUF7423 domain-containing protein n=1 Tax=Gordonia phage Sour TaxID=2182349 RepID=A0A2U8UKX0_9CAUD|nr:hypothetical protein FDJ57_gp59 [Gordonia phage Sour]AWN04260.1 hypothetical protein PBI_SOUR_59 [Gordonia phage Sour]